MFTALMIIYQRRLERPKSHNKPIRKCKNDNIDLKIDNKSKHKNHFEILNNSVCCFDRRNNITITKNRDNSVEISETKVIKNNIYYEKKTSCDHNRRKNTESPIRTHVKHM